MLNGGYFITVMHGLETLRQWIVVYWIAMQARSGLLATGPAGGLGVSHGGGQGDKSVCGVRAAPRKISQLPRS